ncbi:SMC-Scp complex subunit ScpB [Periweissella cryptocerci]|uniref:Segregation and condensation protein B n=1 Tax=Periweissella cryptocerci TaxID=2506420 RepID=A0A4P6YR33_9LACO|nr:SMC-Scp complex subunit ScpB [Periweissella cryptocerci]QBO35053.1 SMC-Scp complex subunit ScpB [Periweissella cryptocerci]
MTNLAQIEGLIFVAGDEGISLGNLATLTGFARPAIQAMIETLTTKYNEDADCSFELLTNDNIFRFATKQALGALIKRYFETPLSTSLSQASLEVLAIIAYRQPVTRVEIDEIRGVQSGSMIQKLQLRNLITDIGRKNEPGRPIMYGTSNYFLNYFGLTSIDELPQLTEMGDLLDNEQMTGDLFLAAFNNRLSNAGLETTAENPLMDGDATLEATTEYTDNENNEELN